MTPPRAKNGLAEGLSRPNVGRRCSHAARRRGGRYGLLSSLAVELGNSHTASPTWEDTNMPVCGWEDGGSVGAQCLVVMTGTW